MHYLFVVVGLVVFNEYFLCFFSRVRRCFSPTIDLPADFTLQHGSRLIALSTAFHTTARNVDAFICQCLILKFVGKTGDREPESRRERNTYIIFFLFMLCLNLKFFLKVLLSQSSHVIFLARLVSAAVAAAAAAQ